MLNSNRSRSSRRNPTRITACLLLGIVAALSAGCGPSIDPAAKADVDRRLATLKPTGQSYPAPTVFVPRPLAVGQWTQHKMVDDKGQPSVMTYKIVGEDAGAFWVEMSHATYTGKTITKMLLFFGDRMNPDTVDIRGWRMKDREGRVTEMDPQMLRMMKSMWRGAIDSLFLAWQGQPQEDAFVPAGAFTGCFKVKTDAAWGPWRSTSMSWSHPAVPLSGMVKSQGIDKPMTMELIGFGETGAVTEIP